MHHSYKLLFSGRNEPNLPIIRINCNWTLKARKQAGVRHTGRGGPGPVLPVPRRRPPRAPPAERKPHAAPLRGPARATKLRSPLPRSTKMSPPPPHPSPRPLARPPAPRCAAPPPSRVALPRGRGRCSGGSGARWRPPRRRVSGRQVLGWAGRAGPGGGGARPSPAAIPRGAPPGAHGQRGARLGPVGGRPGADSPPGRPGRRLPSGSPEEGLRGGGPRSPVRRGPGRGFLREGCCSLPAAREGLGSGPGASPPGGRCLPSLPAAAASRADQLAAGLPGRLRRPALGLDQMRAPAALL